MPWPGLIIIIIIVLNRLDILTVWSIIRSAKYLSGICICIRYHINLPTHKQRAYVCICSACELLLLNPIPKSPNLNLKGRSETIEMEGEKLALYFYKI